MKSLFSRGLVGALFLSLSLAFGFSPQAVADTLPASGVPETVSAEALPTAQINGVVWNQVVAGNTVFVGGEFTSARPAGVPLGGAGQVTRGNLMSYDITTGALLPWGPIVNGKVKDLALSPDGQTLYVAGAFTTIDGANRYRLAAFDVGTGALLSWQPSVNSTISAITVTEDLVYLGGQFTSVGGQLRDGMAAVSRASGAVNAFNPILVGDPQAVAVSPDRTKVVIGGSFTSVNGSSNPGYGLALLDASTSTSLPMQANTVVRNGDSPSVSGSAAILELVATQDAFYGVGYTYSRTEGNLEGVFKAGWNGDLNWLEDCHGDSYSVYPDGGAVYVASHAHYCGNVGGHEQTTPWSYLRAMAFSDDVRGTVGAEPLGYFNFNGQPRPDILHWFPELTAGTFTGQSQAAWSVVGNSSYVAMGGEFPTVNGVAQQGLVRFAKRGVVAPKQKPTINYGTYKPSFLARDNGRVRVGFPAAFDRDNELLNYRVYRDSVVVYETQSTSNPWNLPQLSFVDSGLTVGQTYTYSLRVNDLSGNAVWGSPTTYTYSPGSAASAYQNMVLQSNPNIYWPLDETSGSAADLIGGQTGTVGARVTRGVAGAVAGSTAFNFTPSGSSTNSTVIPQTRKTGAFTFAVEAWFKTTSNSGGAIVNFGQALANNSSTANVDRVLYLANNGRMYFGVNPSSIRTINSTTSYNDGQWHHVVGQMSTSGMQLYVDGALVASRTDTTTARNVDGVWRIGGDRLSGWTANPSSSYINGQIDEVAVYAKPMSGSLINAHYVLGKTGQMPNQLPTAAITSTVTDLTVEVSGAGSNDPDGMVAGYAWEFGDGATATGQVASHAYSAGGTYTVSLTVTDNAGGTATTTQQVTVSPPNLAPTASFATASDGLVLTANGAGSTDLDGSIASYAWQFGDGSVATGVNPTHTYTANGTYEVTLVVTDDDGAASVPVTQQVTVTSLAPSAAFTPSITHSQLTVDGTASSDPDGSVESYAWDFGDGATGSGATATHNYSAPGEYTVTLVVTDNAGVSSAPMSHQVVAVEAPNQSPTAAFDVDKAGLEVAVDAGDSTDPDGSIVSYTWDFGDGSNGAGVNAEHRYDEAGTYTIKLIVTDNKGATDQVTHNVTVAPIPPTAAFSVSTNQLVASFNASASNDADGSVEGYAWDFGDGHTGTGVAPSHTYDLPGSYTATLTVTDDDGATGSVSKQVTVSSFVVQDLFERSVTRWGSADVGGTWTYNTQSYFSTDGHAGVVTLGAAGNRATASLAGVSARDVEVNAKVSVDTNTTGGGVQNTYIVRANGNSDYRLTLTFHGDKQIRVNLTRVVSGAATSLGDAKITAWTFATGDVINVKFAAIGEGTTTLQATVWKDGTAEPTTATLSRTDSSATLQSAGSFAVSDYLTGSATTVPFVVRLHELTVTAG